jgi:hypothetical protein
VVVGPLPTPNGSLFVVTAEVVTQNGCRTGKGSQGLRCVVHTERWIVATAMLFGSKRIWFPASYSSFSSNKIM